MTTKTVIVLSEDAAPEIGVVDLTTEEQAAFEAAATAWADGALARAKAEARAKVIADASAARLAVAPYDPLKAAIQQSKLAELDRYKVAVIDGGGEYSAAVYPFIASDIIAYGGTASGSYTRMRQLADAFLQLSVYFETLENSALAAISAATTVDGAKLAATVNWSLPG